RQLNHPCLRKSNLLCVCVCVCMCVCMHRGNIYTQRFPLERRVSSGAQRGALPISRDLNNPCVRKSNLLCVCVCVCMCVCMHAGNIYTHRFPLERALCSPAILPDCFVASCSF